VNPRGGERDVLDAREISKRTFFSDVICCLHSSRDLRDFSAQTQPFDLRVLKSRIIVLLSFDNPLALRVASLIVSRTFSRNSSIVPIFPELPFDDSRASQERWNVRFKISAQRDLEKSQVVSSGSA